MKSNTEGLKMIDKGYETRTAEGRIKQLFQQHV